MKETVRSAPRLQFTDEELIAEGLKKPIEQVQKILGHSQIDTTMQYAMVNQLNVKNSHQKIMG